MSPARAVGRIVGAVVLALGAVYALKSGTLSPLIWAGVLAYLFTSNS